VGFHIRDLCKNCQAASEQDEGHRWVFNFEDVIAEPRLDARTGETMMWPGLENAREQVARKDDCVLDQIFDENSMVPEQDAGSWNCSPVPQPLSEHNGQTKADRIKPLKPGDVSKREAELAKIVAALQSREEEIKKREETLFDGELNYASKWKFVQDATAKQEQEQSRLAEKEMALNKRSALVYEQERQLQEQASSNVLQSHNVHEDSKRALERAHLKIATCEAEADALRVEVTEQKRAKSDAERKVATQSAEMQQLHNALAEARREARLRGDALPTQLAGQGRFLPSEEALKAQNSRAERELQQTRAELQQAKADLAAANLRLQASPTFGGHRREIDISQAELELAREEIARLREENDRLRSEASRMFGACASTTTTSSASTSASAAVKALSELPTEDRLAIATKLAQKRADLDVRAEAIDAREEAVAAREQEVAARESFFASRPSAYTPSPMPMASPSAHALRAGGYPAVHVPPFYGSSGVPEQQTPGGLSGLVRRITGS
jgi:hypothetical protein